MQYTFLCYTGAYPIYITLYLSHLPGTSTLTMRNHLNSDTRHSGICPQGSLSIDASHRHHHQLALHPHPPIIRTHILPIIIIIISLLSLLCLVSLMIITCAADKRTLIDDLRFHLNSLASPLPPALLALSSDAHLICLVPFDGTGIWE